MKSSLRVVNTRVERTCRNEKREVRLPAPLSVDRDHVGGEGEEVVAGLAGGGVARPLVHAEAARVDVAHVVRDDARLADLVAGDGAGEAAHRGGGRGCGGQGRRVGEERREDGRACKSSGSLSPRLPVGDRQIYRWYLFGPSGLKDYGSATLR